MNLFESKQYIIYGGAAAVLLLIVAFMSCGHSDNQPMSQRDMKSYVKQAQDAQSSAAQSQANTQAIADKIADQKKNIDASIEKLNGVQRDSNGQPKEGRPETTLAGNVIEFSTRGSDSFTFAEKTGFVKIFTPLCSDTTIPGSKTVVLQYHWQSGDNSGRSGCFKLDSFTIVQ